MGMILRQKNFHTLRIEPRTENLHTVAERVRVEKYKWSKINDKIVRRTPEHGRNGDDSKTEDKDSDLRNSTHKTSLRPSPTNSRRTNQICVVKYKWNHENVLRSTVKELADRRLARMIPRPRSYDTLRHCNTPHRETLAEFETSTSRELQMES
ncbi:hypothetical protein BJ508DRAFT_310787 [Ascobolus immersus RN42]|uniref:Uncharacterized protein n=1 Tax=Ascobolus immersus RN42 TaxID=1160509 RepID=A0A3N4HY40_ASCIM|nr:hypothetical protein BJ508DRAFT_310787 [Ascobolus immersus RN42]